MKKVIFAIVLGVVNLIFAQGSHMGGYLTNSQLDEITISGNIIIDSTQLHPMYYLDENNDGTAEYMLNFGPFWYAPDSSSAARPEGGDEVSITAGLAPNQVGVQVVIVYEINGEFWRDPFLANWNNMGRHSHNMGTNHNGMGGQYGFGTDHDSLTTISLQGVAIIDSTILMNHYYLDTDNDQIPDYRLNFGPPWYQPLSGSERPTEGVNIQILGGLLNDSFQIPMIIVYELNGIAWRDSSYFGQHLGGGWIVNNMNEMREFHSPFDTASHVMIFPGWKSNGGMGSGMMNDSLFCQILEVFPENIPNHQSMNSFAAYEIYMFDTNGSNGMRGMAGMGGGRMSFANNLHFQLHYTDMQLNYYDLAEQNITAKYWNESSNNWIDLTSVLNEENNTVSFNTSEVSNYIILTANEITSVENTDNSELPTEFGLMQNYPNPFNPSTTIKYFIPEQSFVSIKVFDSLGREVMNLVNEIKTKGNHEINLVADNLPSGIYYYQIQAGKLSQTKKMILLK